MPLLHWLTHDEDLTAPDRVPFRPLEEAPDLDVGEAAENFLMQGDNLKALKALQPFYAGRVKCISIKSRYTTRFAFETLDGTLGRDKMPPRSQRPLMQIDNCTSIMFTAFGVYIESLDQ